MEKGGMIHRGILKYLERNLSQCQLVHCEFHTDYPER
jgi:hypothetical protein